MKNTLFIQIYVRDKNKYRKQTVAYPRFGFSGNQGSVLTNLHSQNCFVEMAKCFSSFWLWWGDEEIPFPWARH